MQALHLFVGVTKLDLAWKEIILEQVTKHTDKSTILAIMTELYIWICRNLYFFAMCFIYWTWIIANFTIQFLSSLSLLFFTMGSFIQNCIPDTVFPLCVPPHWILSEHVALLIWQSPGSRPYSSITEEYFGHNSHAILVCLWVARWLLTPFNPDMYLPQPSIGQGYFMHHRLWFLLNGRLHFGHISFVSESDNESEENFGDSSGGRVGLTFGGAGVEDTCHQFAGTWG